jgi:hypothetical protein
LKQSPDRHTGELKYASAFVVHYACAAAVAPGAGCRISVTFSPTSPGQSSAILHVLVNGEVARTRYVTGAGTQSAP